MLASVDVFAEPTQSMDVARLADNLPFFIGIRVVLILSSLSHTKKIVSSVIVFAVIKQNINILLFRQVKTQALFILI